VNNPVPLRLLMGLVMTIAIIAAIAAFKLLKFPANAAVIALAVAAIIVIALLLRRKEKNARFEIYYRTAQELGTPLSFSGLNAAFERNGTRFEADFPQDEDSFYFKVTFHLPNIRQKFSIQNRSLRTTHHDDCYWIEEKGSPLPPEFLLQSRNPDFLLELLKTWKIRDEVLSYNVSMWSGISFSFDDGNFEMIWTPPMSEQFEGFDRACRTAVTFHDELQKISVRYLNSEK